MSSQALKDIVAALKSLIEGTKKFKAVYADRELTSQQLAGHGLLPACVITEGPGTAGHYITETTAYVTYLNARIYCSTGDDDARLLDEAICDAVAGDVQLGGTCISCLAYSCDPPIQWPPNENKLQVRDRMFIVTYWRDA